MREIHLPCIPDFLRVSEDFTRRDNFDADSRSAVRRIEDDNPGVESA
jgi:hypothetical protein